MDIRSASLDRAQDRPAIGGVLELLAARPRLVGGDEAPIEGDLLEAGDLDALAVLEGADELSCLEQAVIVPVSSQAYASRPRRGGPTPPSTPNRARGS